jgi:hypothetical protein
MADVGSGAAAWVVLSKPAIHFLRRKPVNSRQGASERVRNLVKTGRAKRPFGRVLTGTGRLRMTSESWAVADIEFQTFDRLIDRKGDHITRHTKFTDNNHYTPHYSCQISAETPPKRPCSTWCRTISCSRRSRYCRKDSSSADEDRRVLSLA